VKNGITASAENISAHVNNVPVFSVDVATGKVSNQKTIRPLLDVCCVEYFPPQTINKLSVKGFRAFSKLYVFLG
jgi:bleomycin hydrolase